MGPDEGGGETDRTSSLSATRPTPALSRLRANRNRPRIDRGTAGPARPKRAGTRRSQRSDHLFAFSPSGSVEAPRLPSFGLCVVGDALCAILKNTRPMERRASISGRRPAQMVGAPPHGHRSAVCACPQRPALQTKDESSTLPHRPPEGEQGESNASDERSIIASAAITGRGPSTPNTVAATSAVDHSARVGRSDSSSGSFGPDLLSGEGKVRRIDGTSISAFFQLLCFPFHHTLMPEPSGQRLSPSPTDFDSFHCRRRNHRRHRKRTVTAFASPALRPLLLSLPVVISIFISAMSSAALAQLQPPFLTPAPSRPSLATPMPAFVPSPVAAPISVSTPFPMATSAPAFTRPTIQNLTTTAPSPLPPPTDVPSNPPSFTPPSPEPTMTPLPTEKPSASPTDFPTTSPTIAPTMLPTFSETSMGTARFRQGFVIARGVVLNATEQQSFQELYESYTPVITSLRRSSFIVTECIILGQAVFVSRRRRLGLRGALDGLMGANSARSLQNEFDLEVDFTMTYTSDHVVVEQLPTLFRGFINDNLDIISVNLASLQVFVVEANPAVEILAGPDPTPAPTIIPSLPPSIAPTTTRFPSAPPTITPMTFSPTVTGTEGPTPVVPAPNAPAEQPSEIIDDGGGGGGTSNIIIVVSVVVAGLIILICLFVYFQRRRYAREQEFQRDAIQGNARIGNGQFNGRFSHQDESWNPDSYYNKYPANAPEGHNASSYDTGLSYPYQNDRTIPSAGTPGALVSPSESLVSNQSLISVGNSVADDGSIDEADDTHNLIDELDQYKDHNLEKMRVDVEGKVTGSEGMMSQALTKALIDDDEDQFVSAEFSWSGTGRLSGPDVEASALGEVMDWLRRNDTASVDQKRSFMQHTLNKMVACVRFGIINPDDGSRSVHECAALLGLQLATQIPGTTIMISGMRTNVIAEDVVAAFDEFGEITEAAVASKPLGFGILRFKSSESVKRMMKKFRSENIYVQDVAVQLRVLQSGYNGGADGSKPNSNRSNRS